VALIERPVPLYPPSPSRTRLLAMSSTLNYGRWVLERALTSSVNTPGLTVNPGGSGHHLAGKV